MGEISILHGSDPDDGGDGPALGFGEVGAFAGDELVGALLRLVEEGLQADAAAVAGLQRLAVRAVDGAEGHMVQLGQAVVFCREPFPDREIKLLEVIGLAEVGDDDDAVHLEMLGAIKCRREVTRGVIGGAVLLADDEGLLGEARVFRVKNHQRSCARLRQVCLGEFAVDPLDLVVVETLAQHDIEFDPEVVVDELEGREGGIVDFFPDGEILRVARLQLDEFLLRRGEHGGIRLGRCVAEFVESFELLERFGGQSGGVEVALVGPDQLAELGAPVADVVVANDFRPVESKQAADGFANDRRAQVADVHLLGRVGGRIIHNPSLAAAGAGGSGLHVLLGIVGLQPGEQRVGLEAEVDEARSGEGNVKMRLQRFQLLDNLRAERARVLFFAFGEGQGAIGLIITVERVRHPHFRFKAPVGQTKPGRGGPDRQVEMAGYAEGEGHLLIEELRLALSKKDFGGLARPGRRDFRLRLTGE